MKRLVEPRRDGLVLTSGESRGHDLLRLFMVAQVVLGHTAAIALLPLPALLSNFEEDWALAGFRLAWRFGPESAYLFVFLSGFMVAGPLIESVMNSEIPQFSSYFGKRMRRLFPTALIAVCATAAIDGLVRTNTYGVTVLRNNYAYDMIEASGIDTFIFNLAFLQPVFSPAFGSNGPLWTLGYIVQYYVIGYVALLAFKTSRGAGVVLLVVVGMAMWIIRPEWLILFVGWMIGGVVRRLRPTSNRIAQVALALGVALFVFSNTLPPLIAAAISIPVGVLTTLGMYRESAMPVDSVIGRNLRRWSNDSFTAYVIHHPVLIAIYAVCFNGSASSTPRFAGFVALSVLGTICASAAVKVGARTIERGAKLARGSVRTCR